MTKTIKEILDQHKVEIINLYIAENKTQVQIAEQFGTSQNNIYKFMKRHGVKKQRERKTVLPKTNNIKTIGEQFKVKIYREPETYNYFIMGAQGKGIQIRDYISKVFSAGYVSMIYIIPEGFEHKFSKITTENNLIYPKRKV
ncbi:hypothetical protein [uncultured Lactococcus sp.]|jgi:transposase-like protein|uniref:helix-turn-helix domain-containing protein n=1 Tax=uncultured Lactococcus sp. TaxID=167973 RepID=UPI0027DB4309|nr:hypothetical protein [uncultured Lactococcus sp.]